MPDRRRKSRVAARTPRRSHASRSNLIVAGLAGSAAIGGLFAGTHPTGTIAVDQIYPAALAAFVTVACSRASRWTWIVLGALAAGLSRSWLILPGLATLAVSFASAFSRRQTRRVGGLIGALGIQVVLRWPHVGFQGSTAIAAVVALGPCVISAYVHLHRRERRMVRLGTLGVAALLVVLAVPAVVGLLLARDPVNQGIAEAHGSLASLSSPSPSASTDHLQRAGADFARAQRRAGAWWSAGAAVIPVLAQQRHAVRTTTRAVRTIAVRAANEVPRADLSSIQYRDGQINLSQVRSLQGPLTTLDRLLASATSQVGDLRNPWLVTPLRTRVAALNADLVRAHRDVKLAAEACQVTPDLLGQSQVRHYFVAFETPAESRGLGGFIGAYGELAVGQGRLQLVRSGHINELNQAPAGTRHLTGPPDYLRQYGGFLPADHFQDVTYAPDLPTVSQVIDQLYPQSGGNHIDGVLAIDPEGLAPLLKITGPVAVPGLATPLTAANVAQVLLRTQYQQFSGTGEVDIERHDFLQGALAQAFASLLRGSLPGPAALESDVAPAVRDGHLLFWSLDPADQAFLSDVGLAGRFPRAGGGDLLSITTQNAANNKIDAYLQRSINDQVRFDPKTGTVESTVTVRLRNEAPATGLPPDVIGSYPGSGLPPGTNKTYFSLYSGLGLDGAAVNGAPAGLVPGQEFGANTYSTDLSIPPGSTTTIVVHLQGTEHPGRTYSLVVHQQPMALPDQDTVTVTPASSWRTVTSPAWNLGAALNQRRNWLFAPTN